MSKIISLMRRYRAELSGFLLILCVHGYFYNGVSWNQNARLDSVYAFVEPGFAETGTFIINRFIKDPARGVNTGDWAKYQDNYYSNKAPGTAVLAVPLYFVLFHGERLLGVDPTAPVPVQFNAYLMNLWVSVFWSALGGAFLLNFLATAWGRTLEAWRDATAIVLVYSFGTLVFPFATQFWGHSTAAAMVLIAFLSLLKDSRRAKFLGGFLFGLAVFTEYLCAAFVVPAFVFFLLNKEHRKDMLAFGAGMAPGILALMVYHKLCFGGFLTTASAMSNPIFTEAGKLAGQFGAFNPLVFLELLFSYNRGVFLFMPVLLVAAGNVYFLALKRRGTLLAVCISAIVAIFVAIACFNGAHGGASTGPRYMIIALPFLCLLLPRLSKLDARCRLVVGLLTVLSVANMLVISAVDPMKPYETQNLWRDQLYGAFFRGEFPSLAFLPHEIFHPSMAQSVPSRFNVGALLFGSKGLATLVPLGPLVVALLFLLSRSLRQAAQATPAYGHRAFFADGFLQVGMTWLARFRYKKSVALVVVLGLGAALRVTNFANPVELVFDEHHYVPAARALVGVDARPNMEQWKEVPLIYRSPDSNFSHPPLAKFLIGLGIKMWGDNSIGMRLPSVLFGIASLVALFFLAKVVLGTTDAALLAMFFAACDFLLVVHSRIAMLDIFMFFFSVVLMLLLLTNLKRRPRLRHYVLIAAVGALGMMVKYTMALTILAFAIVWMRHHTVLKGYGQRFAGGLVIAIFATVFFASWSALYLRHGYSLTEWFQYVAFASEKTVGTLAEHRYGSHPSQWLFNGKPIWYAFKGENGFQSGIVSFGNPVLWLLFIPAMLLVLTEFRQKKRLEDEILLTWYACAYLPLFVILWYRQGFIFHVMPAVAPMACILARGVQILALRRTYVLMLVTVTLLVTLFFLPILLYLPVPDGWMDAIKRFAPA